MRQFKTVMKFEYLNYVRSKSYIVISAIILVLIIIGGSMPKIVDLISGFSTGGESEHKTKAAAILDVAGDYSDELLAAALPGFEWERLASFSGISEKIESDVYAIALEIDGLVYKLYQKGDSFLEGITTEGSIREVIRVTYRENALAAAGLTQAQIEDVMTAEPFGIIEVIGKDLSQTFWLAYAVLLLLYITIVLYGQYTLVSVVTEKSSKAMELLITSAKPIQLMFGKVIGTALAGFTQFGAIILCAAATLRINLPGWNEFAPVVGSVLQLSFSSGIFVYAIVFFFLGFFAFAFIYAAVGSTVSRMEDASTAAQLPMLLFVAVFIVAFTGMSAPNAMYIRVLSFVPFFSPLVMFMRICTTDVPTAHVILSIILNIVYVFGTGYIAAKIYRVGVMIYGGAPKLKDLIRYIRQA